MKLFVIVRADMAVANQAVQAGHAVAEWCKRWHKTMEVERLWDNQTLVYLSVKDWPHLELWIRKIELKSLDFVRFMEPDFGIRGETTAIACLTDSNIFDKLPLWGST